MNIGRAILSNDLETITSIKFTVFPLEAKKKIQIFNILGL